MFRTIEHIPKKRTIQKDSVKGTKRIINVFKKRGIGISQIDADNEFECIREKVQPIILNIVAAGEHVGDIEGSNRSLK